MKKNQKGTIKKFPAPVNVAVVGAGAVGKEMIRLLEARHFPVRELRVLARSTRVLELDGKKYPVEPTTADAFKNIQIALFAGTEGEKGAAVTYGRDAIRQGAVVIDNGADFRMDPKVPLVLPEVNAHDLAWHNGFVANPNCTTAVMLMAVAPLYKKFGVRKIIFSSYQAVSGAGAAAVEDLKKQTREFLETGKVSDYGVFPDQIAFNVLSNSWKIEKDGYSNEEIKAIKETVKILGDKSIQVVPTTVRVPVINSHAESIYVELKKPATVAAVRKTLTSFPGVRVVDEESPLEGKTCPSPIHASGSMDVQVGRIRRDPFNPKGFLLWVVGDNLWKGAAQNAIQIAECLVQK